MNLFVLFIIILATKASSALPTTQETLSEISIPRFTISYNIPSVDGNKYYPVIYSNSGMFA